MALVEQDTLDLLPPLPTPDKTQMRREASMGCSLVLCTIVGCIAATHVGAHLMAESVQVEITQTCLGLVYTAALVALGSLFGLMWGDPGVVQRSPQTCLPIPAEIAEQLRKGMPLCSTENLIQGGRTYCVRCFLWRIPTQTSSSCIPESCECIANSGNRIHHCNTCQRCVENFDHHCGIFGRCIAGRGFGGNMGYFKMIVASGYFGGCVAAISLFSGLSQTGSTGYWVAVVIGGYLSLVCFGWTLVFIFWQLSKRCGLMPFWDTSYRKGRTAGWKNLHPHTGADSDLENSPVDPVVIGVQR